MIDQYSDTSRALVNRPKVSDYGAYGWREQRIVGPGPRGCLLKLEAAADADADTTGGGIPHLGSCLGSIQMYTGEKNVGIDQLLLSLEGG